jgi:hypothetical protein
MTTEINCQDGGCGNPKGRNQDAPALIQLKPWLSDSGGCFRERGGGNREGRTVRTQGKEWQRNKRGTTG